jgi:hypothetical protein
MTTLKNLVSATLFFAFIAILPSFAHAQEKAEVSFTTNVMWGAQKNNLFVVVSSDYDGSGTMEAIQKATWTDVTTKFKYAEKDEWVKSGKQDLSALAVAGKPLYVAFKYIGNASTVGATQRGWAINELVFNGTPVPSTTWKLVNDPKNFEGAGYIRLKDGGVRFRSNLSVIRSESWAIAKAK